jgi:hypothetical protein
MAATLPVVPLTEVMPQYPVALTAATNTKLARLKPNSFVLIVIRIRRLSSGSGRRVVPTDLVPGAKPPRREVHVPDSTGSAISVRVVLLDETAASARTDRLLGRSGTSRERQRGIAENLGAT